MRTRPDSEPRNDEQGSAAVEFALVLPLVLVVLLGLVQVGVLVRDRVLVEAAARAAARAPALVDDQAAIQGPAADAAALAAAQELAIPPGAGPAELAREYAARGGGEMTACTCEAGSFEAVVDVQVSVGDLLLIPGSRVAPARARAVVDLPSG